MHARSFHPRTLSRCAPPHPRPRPHLVLHQHDLELVLALRVGNQLLDQIERDTAAAATRAATEEEQRQHGGLQPTSEQWAARRQVMLQPALCTDLRQVAPGFAVVGGSRSSKVGMTTEEESWCTDQSDQHAATHTLRPVHRSPTCTRCAPTPPTAAAIAIACMH